jgi:hypothetical protein
MKVCAVLAAILLTAALSYRSASSEERASRELFKPVPQHKAVSLPAETEKKLAALRNDVTTKNLWVVEINLNLLESKSLTLNVNTDTPLDASTARIEKRSTNDFTWFGRIAGSKVPGEAVLTVKDGQVFGMIQAEKGQYEVVPLGAGQHAIVEVDQSKLPPDEGHDLMQMEREPENTQKPEGEPKSEESVGKSETTADGKYIIRVIVAYTPAALKRAGGKTYIEGEIQKAIDLTNQSYANSRINAVLALAHTFETTYDESRTPWKEDLRRFSQRGDGPMDEVHSLRERHRGDVAVLVVHKKLELCGLASAIGANADNAFCMVHVDCMNKLYTFGHEIGHLQGAAHNWEADPVRSENYPHNHAFWYKGENRNRNWRTVMSYDCPGPSGLCQRRLFWSNPEVSIDGVPTGTKDCCDNTAVLNATAKKVSSFR